VHYHDVAVHSFYVLKGWVLFEYEGRRRGADESRQLLLPAPRIRHRELKHSDGLEMIEVVSPAISRRFEASL